MGKTPLIPIQTTGDIGKLLRKTREEAGSSQSTTAAFVDVGVRFLGDLERGKPTVRLGLALQVLERLGLQVWIAPRGWKPDE
jgi:HTH-type transcriptional regulator/antitoxin HipB